jgi:protein TonB
MDPNKILKSDLLDIVFEDRNKEYGAYDLRKSYNKRIKRAVLITFGAAVLIFLYSFIANKIGSSGPKKQKIEDVTLTDIKQEEKKEDVPPPPPPKPEPPKVEMTQFTPPKIVKDEEVKPEEKPPEQEKLEETKISNVNQEGTKDEGIVQPTDLDQGKEVIVKKEEDDENKVWEKVEIDAAFPGGEKEWTKFLQRNLNANVPVDNGAQAGKYTVWIQFIVDKEGNVSDIKPLTTQGFGMEDEAMRVLRKVPKWTPAQQNGRYVKAYRKQPITFIVEEQ